MMNNCWFKVRINTCKTKDGGVGLAFLHPVSPGNQVGRWMEQQCDVTLELTMSISTSEQSSEKITNVELKQHNTRDSPWIVIHNSVYDCTTFLEEHPGGSDSIVIHAGTDCSEEFDAIHSSRAKSMLQDWRNSLIGRHSEFY